MIEADNVIEHIGHPSTRTQFNPLTGGFDDDYTWKVRMMIEDARDYNDSYRAPKRETCMEYYLGLKPDLDKEGRSTFVATEARDTILAIMPSLLRIFTAREHVCEYIPNFAEQVGVAEQATDYAHTVFMEDNPGFLIYHNWFKDCLTKGEGAIKWRTDNNVEVEHQTFRGVSLLQIHQLLEENPHASIDTIEPDSNPSPLAGPAIAAQSAQPDAPPNMGDAAQPFDGQPQGGPQLPAPGGNPVPVAPVPGSEVTRTPPVGSLAGGGFGPSSDEPEPEELYNIVLRYERNNPVQVVDGIPPDEFRIDRFAKTIKDAALVGSEAVVMPSDLRKLGYSQDVIDEFAGQDIASVRWNLERSLRNPALDQGLGTPFLYGGINYGEYFIRVDRDGDGIDELRHICVMGNADIIVHDEVVQYAPIAFLTPDPEPHTVVGHSVTELVEDLQRIKTNLLRNSLDAIAGTIYPRLVFNDILTNTDDVLNDELGAPIRSKDPNGVKQLETTFIGDVPMQFVNYVDMVRMQRTGISDASKGLDPKALQSTAVQGVDMVISGAQERIELIARILAETGVKDLFKGLLREMSNSPNYTRMLQVRGKFVPIQPHTYDPSMSVRVNSALGKSSDNDRMVVLSGIKATQEQIIAQLGPDNPVVGIEQYLATVEDLASLGSCKSIDRYFNKVTNQQFSQYMASKPQAPNPMEIQREIDLEKLRATTTKHIADQEYRLNKLEMDEKFRRDKLVSDTMAKVLSAEATAKVPLHESAIEAQIDRDQMESDERIAAAKHASDERIADGRHSTQRAVAASRSAPSESAPAGSA